MTRDRGAVTSEMAVIMVTFFAGFLLLVVYAGRVGQAENDVRTAAQAAARSASLESTPEGARHAAETTAAQNLATAGLGCDEALTVTTDSTNLRPGGTVNVSITCTGSMSDLVSLNIPASKTFTSTATEVIDVYRSDP